MKIYLFLSILFILSSCSNKKKYVFQKNIIGTIATLTFVSKNNDLEAKNIANTLWKAVDKLDLIFSNYKENSELSKLNRHFLSKEYNKQYRVSTELYELLKTSQKLCLDTGSRFNIFVRPLINLWKTSLLNKKLPSKKGLAKIKKLLNCNNIIFARNYGIKTRLQNVSVDLGGIAKGYIIDYLGKILEKKQITDYIVDIGGDMLISGSKFDKAWNIFLKNPNLKDKKVPYLANCHYKNKKIAIATSGSYYRYTELNGHKYSHIINPKTLSPTNTDITSITIIGDSATMVDGYATGLFVMGAKLASKFLDKSFFNGIILSKRGNYEKKTNDCDYFVNFLSSSSTLDTP